MSDATEGLRAVLLTREEAAQLLRVSLQTFKRHVMKELPHVMIGTLVRFDRKDLLTWLEKQKVGPSTEIAEPEFGASASAGRVAAITGPRAAQIAAGLKMSRRRSSKG